MSVTSDLINYYADLLIYQYKSKAKAYATIQTWVTPVVIPQAADPTLPLAVQSGYNLTGTSTAVGVQLDVLGKYAGVTRTGSGILGQPISLNDADFLTLIRMAISTNSSGSSLYDIVQILWQFFPDELLVFDYEDMRMSYLISSTLGSTDLIQLFVTEGLLPRPMGVQIAVGYYPIINSFFGFVTYASPTQPSITRPFNSYSTYHTDWTWLSYSGSYPQPISH